jgi:UDPglucose 6-dehydrogenase
MLRGFMSGSRELHVPITVVGAGYVGLVTGAGFARLGHTVVVLEVDRRRLARLRAGHLPIDEPGLDQLVADAVADGRLEFTDDYTSAIPSSDFVFLAVNTPQHPDGQADTQFVFTAARAVLELAHPGVTIVTKSTVPVGTGDEIEALAAEMRVSDVHVASNPEFLREGTAVRDFFAPDRIVVGANRTDVGRAVALLYDQIEAPVLLTTRRSAELAKYAANALLATRISFINEIAALAEVFGADVDDISRIVGSDARIGPEFLQAGLGWGGSCFPKDLSALAALAAAHGQRTSIIDAVVEVNARQREHAFTLLRNATRGVGAPAVAVLGLAFKPDTDDLRGSPALDVIGRLLEEGIQVRAHDPKAMAQARLVLPNLHYASDAYEAVTGADAVLLATEWQDYLELDWVAVRKRMRGRVVVDGRNVLNGGLLRALGLDYRGFGRRRAREPIPVFADGAAGLEIASDRSVLRQH